MQVVICQHPRRKTGHRPLPRELYRKRFLIELFFHHLKRFRALATRYEKTARHYLSLLHLACALQWLNEGRPLDSGIRRHFDLAQLGGRGPDDIAVADHAAHVDHSSVEAIEHIDLFGALRRGHDDSIGKPLGAGDVPLAGFARRGLPYAQTDRADCDVSGTQREQLSGSLRPADIHFLRAGVAARGLLAALLLLVAALLGFLLAELLRFRLLPGFTSISSYSAPFLLLYRLVGYPRPSSRECDRASAVLKRNRPVIRSFD